MDVFRRYKKDQFLYVHSEAPWAHYTDDGKLPEDIRMLIWTLPRMRSFVVHQRDPATSFIRPLTVARGTGHVRVTKHEMHHKLPSWFSVFG